MKMALLLLAATLLLLALLAAARGVFTDGLQRSIGMFLKLAPLLVVAFLLTGFAEALLPAGLVERWLSDAAGLRGILIAWLAGVLTPAGGLLGLPLAAGLLRAGAGSGVLVTYLASLALLPLLRVPMEVGLYGVRLTALRIASVALLPPVAGVLAQLLTRATGFKL